MMKRMWMLALWVGMTALPMLAQPKIVAHRGYWKTEGSAQNSLTSLQKACDVGCYGSEFDVWLTADGVPVVFHDATWDSLRIENATYPQLQFRQLRNGEFLPTLQQYLQRGKALPGIQLILEIKPHSTPERDDRVAEMCVALVRQLGLEAQTEYISFSRRVCRRVHEMAPESKVAYLNGDLSPKEAHEQLGVNGIDYHHGVLKRHPEWIAEAHRLGMEVNVWTVDGEAQLRHHATMEGIDLITTNEPEVLKRVMGQ
ncbi:MAG: glycerophosphodiester phosphodiesterase [Prevotella sp.]|nr:glycerophosphodiester phosphodiesterase [Prevotella sp.]